MGDRSKPLTDAERLVLWEQFVEVHSHQQEAYDTSIRTLAAAGVAVTASIGAALEEFSRWAVIAVVLLLASLAFNLVSYWTSQKDMDARLNGLSKGDDDAAEGTGWTKTTHVLNLVAGATLVVGGSALAGYVWSAT